MIRSICGFLALLIAAVTPVAAQTLQAVVKNGKHDLSNAPVRVPLQWPKDAAASTVTVHAGEKTLVGQLTYPSFATESIKAEEGKVRKDLKIGICGEHGGEPDSVKFCHKIGLNYVSCSPFRVPIARLAAAQATLGK